MLTLVHPKPWLMVAPRSGFAQPPADTCSTLPARSTNPSDMTAEIAITMEMKIPAAVRQPHRITLVPSYGAEKSVSPRTSADGGNRCALWSRDARQYLEHREP